MKRFIPMTGSDQRAFVAQVNRNFAMLDKEVDSKRYGSADNSVRIGRLDNDQTGISMTVNGQNSIQFGLLPNGKYGMLVYDTAGKARVLIGQAPDDTIGMWVSKEGVDVLSLFS